MSERLTPQMLKTLKLLGDGPRSDISDEASVKALSRRGLAERSVASFGFMQCRHHWKITEAGRVRLRDLASA